MKLTLRLAQELADLERMSGFDRIAAAKRVRGELEDMQRALRDVQIRAVKDLRKSGVTWEEMHDYTGLHQNELMKLGRS